MEYLHSYMYIILFVGKECATELGKEPENKSSLKSRLFMSNLEIKAQNFIIKEYSLLHLLHFTSSFLTILS